MHMPHTLSKLSHPALQLVCPVNTAPTHIHKGCWTLHFAMLTHRTCPYWMSQPASPSAATLHPHVMIMIYSKAKHMLVQELAIGGGRSL